METLGENN